MLRRTFHILTLVSLLLMIGSCVAWVRSYVQADVWDIGGSITVANSKGSVTIMDQWLAYRSPSLTGSPRLAQAWAYELQWWWITSISALLPVVWIIWRIKGRIPPGHCPTCGYDMRGSPDTCPECGHTT